MPFLRPQKKTLFRLYFEENEKNNQGASLLRFKTKCINSNISTSLAPLEANWVSKEAENFKKLKLFRLGRYFSVKMKKLRKTAQKCGFSHAFQSILDILKNNSNHKNSSSLNWLLQSCWSDLHKSGIKILGIHCEKICNKMLKIGTNQ